MLRRWILMLLALLMACGLAASRLCALPDAQLVRIEIQGEDYEAGDRVPVSVVIRNGGDSPLPPVLVTLVVGSEPYADWMPSEALAPGDTVTWRLTYTGGRGMHLLVATIDPLNDVPETDYGNNSAFVNLGLAEARPAVSSLALAMGIASLLVGLVAGILLRRSQPGRRPLRRPTQRPSGEKRERD